MRVTANLQEKLIPEFNGNLDLAENEQIIVDVEFPDNEEIGQLKAWRMTGTGELRIVFDTKTILRRYVRRIYNLEDSVNGKIVQIDTGEKLGQSKNPKLRKLIDEIIAYITKDLDITEEDEKNSESPVS